MIEIVKEILGVTVSDYDLYLAIICAAGDYYIEGCYQIDFSMIGNVDMSHCLILLDELPTLIKILFDPKNNLRFVWRPRWYRYFDTKTAPPLQKVDFKLYE